MADQDIAGFIVHLARGGAHLIVRVRCDVFHEKIENARFTLQHSNDLQSAVGGFNRRRGRGRGRPGHGRRFPGEAEFGHQIVGQFSPEQERKECAKSQQDTVQSRYCSRFSA